MFGGGDRVRRQERLGELVALRVELGHRLDGAGGDSGPTFRPTSAVSR